MGCNCKGGKVQKLNNLDSQDHINQAREVWDRVITGKDVGMFNEFETREVIDTFFSLYPNAKTTPSVQNAVDNINHALQNFRKR